ncbi:MAG: Ger(x)C family spore germination protein [Clostridium tyrobutyricum]|jgi:Ger(x)C family germination protein/spore germination protein (amino acid permease)|uniref:Ger(x)C family spore germination protein n=1 Tax=Clostridium tyrobutyricum TaxID=1519 RepID=UPI00031B23DE|nr:Ger(x)C family spore germination protein [Clostridium tyrobutyricum]MBR9648857.1 Ger(x)C family spore germination protein [Clostridium tyrobutyricum]MBV4421489.1 Ger(x)C family spore germination protein [Clostridium tyrobutyricum]MBV4424635.1 Ger(x)C family spore germination protein [Clostridium tyrobutyricum]MCH4236365.1 Ger(x)C family spore germination protein [Clostridium tyrobutyricum]MCH4258476.1 Ger(x)C family spore germination protein [Clostridium tyrobutyricum]
MKYKKFITSFGLFSTIIVTVIGVGIFSYPQEISSIVGTDGWIVTIFAGLIAYLLLYIAYLAVKRNGYNKLYIILNNNFGKIFGGILALIFIAYNIISISFGMRIFTEVVKMYLLEKTPTEFIFIVTILTGMYLITGGLGSLVKFNEISFWIMFVPVIIMMIFTLNNVDFSNILPVFNNNPIKYAEAFKTCIYSFSGIEIIYLMIPFIKSRFSLIKTTSKSIVFITVFYAVIVILSLSVFSKHQTNILLWPTMTMMKSINIQGAFIERWEGVAMAMWVMFYFTTFSNLYYLSSDIVKDMFKLKSITIPSIVLGVIVYIIALYPKNIATLYDMGNKFIPPLFIFNVVILPMIILLFRKLKKKSIIKKVMPLILICVLLTGCWDKVEIENKQLVSIIGVDTGEDIDKQKYLKNVKPEDPLTSIDLKKIHLTFGSPDLSQLGPDKGAQAEDKYIDADGYSFQDAVSKARLKSSRSIRFSHTSLLVFSDGIMEHPYVLKEILDYLQREPSLNRNMYIVVVQGKAERYIKLKTNMEKNMESYIIGLINNDSSNTEIIPVSLNDFLVQMNENGNSLLPKIGMDENNKDVKVLGSLAIKNFKAKGILNPTETANIEFLKGKLKGSKRMIYLDNHPVDIDINNTNRKISVGEVKGKLQFNIHLRMEAQIKNYYLDKNLFSVNTLKFIQDNFNKSIKIECEEALKKIQQELVIDPIGLGKYLEEYHPGIWNRVKDNWDNEYKDSTINVNIDTQIRRIGVVK